MSNSQIQKIIEECNQQLRDKNEQIKLLEEAVARLSKIGFRLEERSFELREECAAIAQSHGSTKAAEQIRGLTIH